MGHTYANVLIHVIFSTKGRQPLIRESFRERLYEYMGGLARQEFGPALSIGGTENHVHGLLSINTSISIGEAMSKWKSLSSGWVHKAFAEAPDFGWQSGYGVFSVSQSNALGVKKYIEAQPERHQTRTFEEEFIAFLKRHGVRYDPERLWD